jgi:DNA adenine methylase
MKPQPVIKWSGSKRSQADDILKNIPNFSRYYEPFIGGGSIAYAVNPDIGICGDICTPLIDLWKIIKLQPLDVYDSYLQNWNKLDTQGYQVYYEIRERFNKTKNPYDLFFLSRTCVNGLIRFNNDGEFNNSLHHTRKGINPTKIREILLDWSCHIKGIEFLATDYKDSTSTAKNGDFIYLDPPYFNTKGRYYGKIDYDKFLEYLDSLNTKGIKFALSYDGSRGENDYSVNLPKSLYKRHILLQSGNSSFKKVMDKEVQMVYESLYLNY